MKISDVNSENLKGFLEDGAFGELMVDRPTDQDWAYGFMKIDMGQRMTVVMGNEVYLSNIDQMTPEEIADAVRSAMSKAQTSRFGKIEPLLYIDEIDKSLYATEQFLLMANKFGLDVSDEACWNWSERLAEPVRAAIQERLSSHLIERTRRASEGFVLSDNQLSDLERSVAADFVKGADPTLEDMCAQAVRAKVEDLEHGPLDFKRTGLCELLRKPEAIVERAVDLVKTHAYGHDRLKWDEMASDRILAKLKIMESLRSDPDPDLLSRREMYAALEERFAGDAPVNVKVTFSNDDDREQFTIGYEELKRSLACNSDFCEHSIGETGAGRERFCALAKDATRSSSTWMPVTNIETILYRGKPVYERTDQHLENGSPSLASIAQEAKAAAVDRSWNTTPPERDGR